MMVAPLIPKFERPPVFEVVHGIQFRRLDMHIGHPGWLHERLRDKYPKVQTVPALSSAPPDEHPGSGIMLRFELPRQDELPRAWFISADDTMLVQVQRDRFLLNWRARPSLGEYPHFASVAAEFGRVFEIFRSFASEAGLGDLLIEQCEMTYLNRVGTWAENDPITPDEWLRCLSPSLGPEWSGNMSGLASKLNFPVREHSSGANGMLTVSVATMREITTGNRVLQLDLTVRGTPVRPDPDGVKGFHEFAHDQIVRCFAALTTDTAHRAWGRIS
jgi:uncharacterized protein (TIGR04255 family)